MKERKIILILIFIILILISVILNLVNKGTVNNQKQIIKRMSSQEYENSITALNESQIAYANSIEQNKINLASAITNAGVPTASNASFETMIENIPQILFAKTSDATATEEDIVEGKTAYVNGQLLIGERAVSNNCDYEIVLNITHSVYCYGIPGNVKTISENVTITIIDGVVTCPSSFYFDTNRKSGAYDVAGWVTPIINSISVVSITRL